MEERMISNDECRASTIIAQYIPSIVFLLTRRANPASRLEPQILITRTFINRYCYKKNHNLKEYLSVISKLEQEPLYGDKLDPRYNSDLIYIRCCQICGDIWRKGRIPGESAEYRAVYLEVTSNYIEIIFNGEETSMFINLLNLLRKDHSVYTGQFVKEYNLFKKDATRINFKFYGDYALSYCDDNKFVNCKKWDKNTK